MSVGQWMKIFRMRHQPQWLELNFRAFPAFPPIPNDSEWCQKIPQKECDRRCNHQNWNYFQVYHPISLVKQPNQIPTYKKKHMDPPTFNNPIPTKKRYPVRISPHGPHNSVKPSTIIPPGFSPVIPKQWIAKSPEEAERNNKLGHNSTPKVTMSMPPSGAHGNGVFSKKNRTHPGFHHRFGEIQMGEKNCWVYIMVMYAWCVCWLLCLKQNDGHGRGKQSVSVSWYSLILWKSMHFMGVLEERLGMRSRSESLNLCVCDKFTHQAEPRSLKTRSTWLLCLIGTLLEDIAPTHLNMITLHHYFRIVFPVTVCPTCFLYLHKECIKTITSTWYLVNLPCPTNVHDNIGAALMCHTRSFIRVLRYSGNLAKWKSPHSWDRLWKGWMSHCYVGLPKGSCNPWMRTYLI